MSKFTISDHFDSGNINVVDASKPNDIQLEIPKDNASDFLQWFHFSLEGEIGETFRIRLLNASQCSYNKGWEGYKVCTSWDRQEWFRTAAAYTNGELSFEITLTQSTVYFAYFTPYSYERHLDLLAWAQTDLRCSAETLGKTIDGRNMTMLKLSNDTDSPSLATPSIKNKQKVWVIARQHPGETMAEWFIEGLLHSLLDEDNPIAKKLLQSTEFYVVPNMNPDGSARGNLRTNAAGANLNREWLEPSLETSPEVYLVRQRMMLEGGDLFLDIHGDEELPYNFVAGCEGNESYDDRHAELEEVFKNAFMAISPDFQDTYGYPKEAKGAADLRIAANWLGDHFRTLSFTIEMPFKDNADLPNPITGWSADRSAQLGSDVLFPISETLSHIAK